MKFLRFIFSKFFWINFILALLALYVIFYLTMRNLDSYTNHSVKLKVPNLKNTARWLNGEGVLTRRGGKWTGSNLHSQIQRLNWNWRELAKSC